MPLFSTDAIVIKRVKLGDADRIVTFFTSRFGKIQAVAKGGRRTKSKFGASLETFTYSNIIFFGKENASLFNLNSADILEPFQDSRDNYDKLMKSIFLLDVIDHIMKERDINPALFSSLVSTLRSVSAAKKMDKVDTRVNLFLLGLISEAGYRPSLKGCIFCRNPVRPLSGFNIEMSGVVCNECIEASPETSRLSRGSLSFLKASRGFSSDSAADRVTLSPEVNMEINSLLKNYLRFHTGHTPFKKSKTDFTFLPQKTSHILDTCLWKKGT